MRPSGIAVKRAYDSPRPEDGTRYLVDRFWPRAVKKKDLHILAWLKDVAPSQELRRWFEHDPAKWEEFQLRYRQELDANLTAWEPLLEAGRAGKVTLVYAARDTKHNNAVALKSYLEDQLAEEHLEAVHQAV